MRHTSRNSVGLCALSDYSRATVVKAAEEEMSVLYTNCHSVENKSNLMNIKTQTNYKQLEIYSAIVFCYPRLVHFLHK